jgi:hypothetical protein
MAGEQLRVKPHPPGTRFDHPDHGVIGQPLGANPAAFTDRAEQLAGGDL